MIHNRTEKKESYNFTYKCLANSQILDTMRLSTNKLKVGKLSGEHRSQLYAFYWRLHAGLLAREEQLEHLLGQRRLCAHVQEEQQLRCGHHPNLRHSRYGQDDALILRGFLQTESARRTKKL